MTTDPPSEHQPRVYKVLHTEEGTVLALIPAESIKQDDGTEIASEVVPGHGEAVTEVELTPEQLQVPLIQLFEDHDVHIDFAERRLVFTPRPRESAD
jgi:hypothetical protein